MNFENYQIFEFLSAIIRKIRGRKISKLRFSGAIFYAQKHDFFRNSNFSEFLRIKSEINHAGIYLERRLKFFKEKLVTLIEYPAGTFNLKISNFFSRNKV